METTSEGSIDTELAQKERIKQRNGRDLEHSIIGAAFALSATCMILPESNTALPYIALAAAILWSILVGIDIAKKNWISVFITFSIAAYLYNKVFTFLP